MIFVGIDTGTSGGIAAVSGSKVMYASTTKIPASKKGSIRLIYYSELVRKCLEDVKDAAAGESLMVYIEEAPNVRNIKAYGVLMQYLAIASVTAHKVLSRSPVTLTVPQWKSLIKCANRVPSHLKPDRKTKERWLKEYIYEAVTHLVSSKGMNVLIDAANNTVVSDVYDAAGIALAGQIRFNKVELLELE